MLSMSNYKVIEVEVYSEEDFEDMLDEGNDAIFINRIEFLPSQVLKACDPIAWRVFCSDMQEYKEVYECRCCGTQYEDKDEAEICCADYDSVDDEE
jgi:hypothetical protein